MKVVEKEFVNKVDDLLNKDLSENNRYFLSKVKEIFNSESCYDINIININDFSELLDILDYEGYNRGLLIMKVVVNNFRIIDSKPYSKINISKYQDIFLKRNISDKQFIDDVRNLVDYCFSNEDIVLDEYQYEIFKMLHLEEKKRLEDVKVARKVKDDYENLNVLELLKYFEKINLKKKDLEGLKIYLDSLKEKKNTKNDSISFEYELKPIKLGYTNKEIRMMDDELNSILKRIDEEEVKISYDEYLHYVNDVFALIPLKKACEADINKLYDSLIINENLYSFLVNKAKSLLNSRIAIDILEVLQDINDIESILKFCTDDEKEDFKEYLKSIYYSLYELDSFNYNYERTLVK